MKKLLPIIIYILALMAVSLLTILLLPGCSKEQYSAIQTQIHDFRNEVKDAKDEDAAFGNFKRDCKTEQVTFGEDSFGFYTRCPNTAKPLKKQIIKKSYHLTHED